jgi:metal-responsive CopG/Arc/MetJ family transcriptional regulator
VRKLAEAVQRIYLIAPVDWLREIDVWRRKQHPEIPSRSAAIRQLVSEALAAHKAEKKK